MINYWFKIGINFPIFVAAHPQRSVPSNLKNIVVFASGSGSNFQAIIDSILSGSLNAKVTGLITDRDGIHSIDRASIHNIPSSVIIPAKFSSIESFADRLLENLAHFKADIIVLAGYLKMIPIAVIKEYEGRILNIHPSLLPKYGGKGFYGLKVHKAVLAARDTESGCTVHLVNEIYDDGPILGQAKVPVFETDDASTLAARVLEKEHQLYPKVISEYLNTLT